MRKLFLSLIIVLNILCLSLSSVHASEVIGEEEKPNYRAFLQETTIVLAPYQQSFSFGLSHKRDKVDQVFSANINREISSRASYHLGLPRNVEAYVDIPTTWRERTSQDKFESTENKKSTTGVGDILIGTKFLVFKHKKFDYEVIGSFEASIPSGKDPYSKDLNALGLGSGHWIATTGFTFVKPVDPAIVYFGLSYSHPFSRRYNDKRINPGIAIGYNMGIAFSINNKITFSEQFVYNYQTQSKIDSEKIPFSASEPAIFRSALSYAINKNSSIEPYIVFGLNDEASDVSFGLSYSWRR